SNGRTFAPYRAGNGTLTLERGSNTLTGLVRVGGRGTGAMTVRNASTLSAPGGIWIGPDSSSYVAQMSVRGLNTLATVGSSFSIAGDSLAKSGHQLSVADVDSSATLNYTGTSPIHVWEPGGQLYVRNGAQLTSAAEVRVGGSLYLTKGTVTAPLVTVTGTGTINGAGTLKARVNLSPAGEVSMSIAPAGSKLTVGDSTAGDGFTGLGTVNTFGDTVVILDSDGIDVGSISMGSGGAEGTLY